MKAALLLAALMVSCLMAAGVARPKVGVAQILVASNEHVTAIPAEGALQTRFVFYGKGFAPNRVVSARITLPDGSERRFRTADGIENVWLTRADGSFEIEFVPAQRFTNAMPGHWQALLCGEDSPTCQKLDLDISP